MFILIKITTFTQKGEGLFPDKIITTATKGIKLLEHPTSLTLCEAIVKYAKWRIIRDKTESYEFKQHLTICNNPNYSIQFLNFRAESRETRDLMQDLSDIKEGIKVIHDSDTKKAAKAIKHERRVKAIDDKKRKLRNKIIEVGFDGLNDLELRHYHKWFEPYEEDEIMQQIQVRKELTADNENEQLSLF